MQRKKQTVVNCVILSVLSILILDVSSVFSSSNMTMTMTKGNVQVLNNVKQIPSEPSDFPGNNPDFLYFKAYKPVQDSDGLYHLRGEVTNISNNTLLKTKVSAILFDDKGTTIGSAKPWYVSGGLTMNPLKEGAFDLIVHPDDLSGDLSSYRLMFSYSIK